jgi:hypothetical protein
MIHLGIWPVDDDCWGTPTLVNPITGKTSRTFVVPGTSGAHSLGAP